MTNSVSLPVNPFPTLVPKPGAQDVEAQGAVSAVAVEPVSDASKTDSLVHRPVHTIKSPSVPENNASENASVPYSSQFVTQIIKQYSSENDASGATLTYQQLVEYSNVKFKPSNAGHPIDSAENLGVIFNTPQATSLTHYNSYSNEESPLATAEVLA